jgi:predicted acylesterase/phospholipase RssA
MSDPLPKRHALVLSGGGIRLATHIGLMAEMDPWRAGGDRWLDRFKVLVGTSAGAVYAALYAASYTPSQIATLARIFADETGKLLFDYNFRGAAEAYLRNDLRHMLGFIRGDALLALFETVFSRRLRSELQPLLSSKGDGKAAREFVVREWEETRRAEHNEAFYVDQLTFADYPDLFVIAVNVYTGQKTIFCKVTSDTAKWPAEDDAMFNAATYTYINTKDEISERIGENDVGNPDDTFDLDFRRYENRVYRKFDPRRYGEQLPLALAVRASMSIPVIFEPARILRKDGEHDFFVDGGVDDNFSLSVAVDPGLGRADSVLGIMLGNLGYRLPDFGATTSPLSMLTKTTEYMGDALLDTRKFSRELNGRNITVVDALPDVSSQLTDTSAIEPLIEDGYMIARDFWKVVHGREDYSKGGANVEPSAMFPDPPQFRVYLSPAAQTGPFDRYPRPDKIETGFSPRDIIRIPFGRIRGPWVILPALLAALALAIGGALLAIFEVARHLWINPSDAPRSFLIISSGGVACVIVGLLFSRAVVYWGWLRRRPAVQGPRQAVSPGDQQGES